MTDRTERRSNQAQTQSQFKRRIMSGDPLRRESSIRDPETSFETSPGRGDRIPEENQTIPRPLVGEREAK